MDTVRNILKHFGSGVTSMRQLGRMCGCSKNTASTIITIAKSKHITYEIAKHSKDDYLKSVFYPNNNPYRMIPEPDMNYIDRELKHKHVTMKTLHEEYLMTYPEGLRYTQFCERYREYTQNRKISMHVERKAGERMEIDWSGDQMDITDPNTGEISKVNLLVVAIGRSGYPYVEAFAHKDLPSFISGVCSALSYFGGVPSYFVPDNDKSAVTKAKKYDSIMNKTFQEMADYYGAAIIPARVRAPKDKPLVEKTILDLAEREIIGKSRHMKFFSIDELNIFIKKAMKSFSNKHFQKKEGTRLSVFLDSDFPQLKPLPLVPFEFTSFKVATVSVDYHVSFEHNYYSVPFQYVRQKVELKIKRNTIEIIKDNERIAIHKRILGKKYKFSTDANHMTDRHSYVNGLSRDYFESWAATINASVFAVVEGIFNGRKFQEQGFRSCMGLQSLHKKYPSAFIAACEQACSYSAYGYSYVNQFMQKILEDKGKSADENEVFIKHDNIRGIRYYQTTLANFPEGES